METKTFYYKFRKIDTLLILNILLAALLAKCLSCFPSMIYWLQVRILIGLVAVSSLIWGWLHLLKHKMATIDNNGITIAALWPGKTSKMPKKKLSAAASKNAVL